MTISPRTDASTAPRQGIARHGRLHSTSVAESIGKFAGLAALVVAVASLILGMIVYAKLRGGLDVVDVDTASAPQAAAIEQVPGGVNILLVGSDDRTGQGQEFGEGQDDAQGRLNDVNIVIHLAQDLSHAEVVSIPRDTIVDTAACRSDTGEARDALSGVPMNSILEEGGMNCITATVEQMSGLDIHYTAMVKFRGVIAMSNAVGGVTVCVADPIDDPYVGLTLSAGEHTLQGEDALKFLRTRHGVGDGSDLARISNQQVFLSALIREIKSAGTLTDPAKLYGLALAVTQNMSLSRSLDDLNTLMSLATGVARIPTGNIAFISLPVAASWQEGKVEPSEPQADELWALLREDRSFAAESSPTPTPAPASSGAPAEPQDPAEAAPTQAADPAATPTIDPNDVQHLNADQVTCANSQ